VWTARRNLAAVNLSFLDSSRYFFFQVAPHLSSRVSVGPVPDPLLHSKSGSAGNRTRDLWVCSQEVRTLDHRSGPDATITILNVSFLKIGNLKHEICQHNCLSAVKLCFPRVTAVCTKPFHCGNVPSLRAIRLGNCFAFSSFEDGTFSPPVVPGPCIITVVKSGF
jgi:hypothetical protein